MPSTASCASASRIAIHPSPSLISTPRIDLAWLSPDVLRGLRNLSVTEIGGVTVPEAWVTEGTRHARLLALRLEQMEGDPRRSPWLLRAIVDRERRAIVGHVGFHGAPGTNALGADDAVELGFTVEPPFRRQGYASEAALALMRWAQALGVRRFLASVGPTNAPSLALVRKLGFVEVTRVEDEEDGPEIVFELRV